MKPGSLWAAMCGNFILYAFKDWTAEEAMLRIPMMLVSMLTVALLLYLGERIEVRWKPRASSSGDTKHG